ncbi:MAG: hypothetical protein AVDCRST_MAG74-96 [uncultured Pyrinomonadaceae bacterium]|uniref:2-dehydro-3-deoxy-phosphogluconate aldolase n=1 Tax=uncultured Pyrinomonadaceae bacterium TaxID=2283094 RepID=A0A6J4N6K2_9BACT|nr:MAG: hypothetical protein AVDCRST_MAG74-96 [uncultured Pyrinomonadaceae bacterium]
MKKSDAIRQIKQSGVIPVVRAESGDEARRVIEALVRGGISILEITMTVPDAIGLIEETVARFGENMLTGAGTVLDA